MADTTIPPKVSTPITVESIKAASGGWAAPVASMAGITGLVGALFGEKGKRMKGAFFGAVIGALGGALLKFLLRPTPLAEVKAKPAAAGTTADTFVEEPPVDSQKPATPPVVVPSGDAVVTTAPGEGTTVVVPDAVIQPAKAEEAPPPTHPATHPSGPPASIPDPIVVSAVAGEKAAPDGAPATT